jgi:Family of unknown function (DUF5677)
VVHPLSLNPYPFLFMAKEARTRERDSRRTTDSTDCTYRKEPRGWRPPANEGDGTMSQGKPEPNLNQDAALWLGCLDRIIACGEGIAETARIKDDDARVLAACLLARSISTARAVVHLIGLGHVVEARMLARSIFENESYLCRLAQDDDGAFVREMKADEAFNHRGLGKAIKEGLVAANA